MAKPMAQRMAAPDESALQWPAGETTAAAILVRRERRCARRAAN